MAKDARHYCLKQELWALIQSLGRRYGEDDEFIRVYAIDVYTENMEDLEAAVLCFRDLVKNSRWMEKTGRVAWEASRSGYDRRLGKDG